MSDPIVFIPLTQGKVAVVDFSDFESVRGYRWYASSKQTRGPTYARRTIPHPTKPGKQSCILMHSAITGWKSVDHRNGNGLDNRRCNLREFTVAQNSRSLLSFKSSRSSKYRGVFRRSHRRWSAGITVNQKAIALGYFDSEEEAARAYDRAAKRFGFFDEALNFPQPRDADFKILP